MVKRILNKLRQQPAQQNDASSALLLEGTVEPIAVTVLVVELEGREGREVSARLADFLMAFPGLSVTLARKRLKVSGDSGLVERLSAAGAAGRALLAQEGADVLIWGEVAKDGGAAFIRFLPSAPDAEGKTGTFGLGDYLELPAAFGEELGDIAAASAIAAAVPVKGDDDEAYARALVGAASRVNGYVELTPQGLTASQAAAMLTCLGVCFAAMWRVKADDTHLDRAIQIYSRALEICPASSMPISHALVQNHLASAYEARAARNRDPEPLERATRAYQAVTQTLDPRQHPQDWGFAQNRLGAALYRLALRRGNSTADLKASIKALEAARLIFTRDEASERWAEVTNQMGVALMGLGMQVSGPEALERSVAAFRETMEIRHQESSPLLWAQTANNLGAALFALYRRKGIAELLDEAEQGFEGAHAIYSRYGEARMVEVIEKNLDRVRLARKGGRQRKAPPNGRR